MATRVCLTITTYRRWVPRAIHYFGELREYDVEYGADGPERNGVWFEMTAKDTARVNEKDGLVGQTGAWQVGDHHYAFLSREGVLKAAIPCAREAYGEDVEVYVGNIAMALEDMVRLV